MLLLTLVPIVALFSNAHGELTGQARIDAAKAFADARLAARRSVDQEIRDLEDSDGPVTTAHGPIHQLSKFLVDFGDVERSEYYNDFINHYVRSSSTAEKASILEENSEIINAPFPDDGVAPTYPDCSTLCDSASRYATLDGTCNNLQYCLYGSSGTTMRRILAAQYEEDNLPRLGNETPFKIATRTFNITRRKDPRITADNGLNQLLSAFSQYLVHDITGAAARPVLKDDGTSLNIKCSGLSENNVEFENCFDILKFSGSDEKTMYNFIRSAPGLVDVKNSFRFSQREQVNQQSSVIDNSQLYGLTQDDVDRLVDKDTGKFYTEITEQENFGDFPIRNEDQYCVVSPSKFGKNATCFDSGDGKMNVYLPLMMMHILAVKEHNDIVDRLTGIDSSLSPEAKFQEARRILNAMFQSITYNQYLPLMIGPALYNHFGLSATQGTTYDNEQDPGIINSFAASAFRHGHSLIYDSIRMAKPNGDLANKASIHSTFFRTVKFWNSRTTLSRYLMGLALDEAEKVDTTFSSAVGVGMFGSKAMGQKGVSLPALNIQRGRDHGLPTCGPFMDLVKDALEEASINENIARINDIDQRIKDLFHCGLEEDHVEGGSVGPIFAYIMGLQFKNIAKGDRFFYAHTGANAKFTADARQEIEKATLSYLICKHSNTANRNLQMVHKYSFKIKSNDNPLADCDDVIIPQGQPDILVIYNNGS